jgi:hypothetical protein
LQDLSNRMSTTSTYLISILRNLIQAESIYQKVAEQLACDCISVCCGSFETVNNRKEFELIDKRSSHECNTECFTLTSDSAYV